MKRIINIVLIVSAFSLAGCKGGMMMSEDEGVLSFSLACNSEYLTKAAAPDVALGDFSIDIERPYDGWNEHFDRYADMPATMTLARGQYIVTATSPAVDGMNKASFDMPLVFSGSEEFSVMPGEVTSVSLTCYFKNVEVTLKPTEHFVSELQNITVYVSVGEGTESETLCWDNDEIVAGKESKPGYFPAGDLHVYVSAYRTIDNSPASVSYDIKGVSAQDHRIIRLDACQTGTAGFEIKIDYTTNPVEDDVRVPGFDTPVPGPGTGNDDEDEDNVTCISLAWPENPEFAPTVLESQMDVKLAINVEHGIKSFLVKIASPSVSFMGAVGMMATSKEGDVAVLDLTNAATFGKMKGVIESLAEYDTLEEETYLDFDLGGLLPLILEVGDDLNDGDVNRFTMDITDMEGHHYAQPLDFVYKSGTAK